MSADLHAKSHAVMPGTEKLITIPTQRQGPGAVMGDSVPYQLFLIRATDAIAVSRDPLPDFLLALLALDNATPGYLDCRGWICLHTGRLRCWGRQANIHYWATTARTAAGEFNCSGSAQAGHQPRSRARDTGAETLEPSRPGRTGSLVTSPLSPGEIFAGAQQRGGLEGPS